MSNIFQLTCDCVTLFAQQNDSTSVIKQFYPNPFTVRLIVRIYPFLRVRALHLSQTLLITSGSPQTNTECGPDNVLIITRDNKSPAQHSTGKMYL